MAFVALFTVWALAACSATYTQYDSYDLAHADAARQQAASSTLGGDAYSFDDDMLEGMMVAETATSASRSRGGALGARRGSPAPNAAPPMIQAPEPARSGPAPMQPHDAPMLASNGDDVPDLSRDAERQLPLLIYTGGIVLAIYDVDATKTAAVAVVEEMGGYASQRTGDALVLRVPAERFREALDALGDLGDTLSVTWDAQDVGDEFNDLEVRLRNARQMRDRLELLLQQAENVSDALAIERELERVTLEIERIEGQRRQMVDRIAFATITVTFSRMHQNAVPGEEYRLPFQWLNQIGVERLLSL